MVVWAYEHRSRPTARFWLSRSERSNLLLLGLVGAETRFHASTRISATQPVHLVCAGGGTLPGTSEAPGGSSGLAPEKLSVAGGPLRKPERTAGSEETSLLNVRIRHIGQQRSRSTCPCPCDRIGAAGGWQPLPIRSFIDQFVPKPFALEHASKRPKKKPARHRLKPARHSHSERRKGDAACSRCSVAFRNRADTISRAIRNRTSRTTVAAPRVPYSDGELSSLPAR